jgi:hypothetical protein
MTIPSYQQAKAVEKKSLSLTLNDGTHLSLILNEVNYQKCRADFPGKQQEPFSLYFVGTHNLPQGIYTLRNDIMGEWMLFLVPIGHDSTTAEYTYQALINN